MRTLPSLEVSTSDVCSEYEVWEISSPETSEWALTVLDNYDRDLPTLETDSPQKNQSSSEYNSCDSPSLNKTKGGSPNLETSQCSLPSLANSSSDLPSLESAEGGMPSIEENESGCPSLETRKYDWLQVRVFRCIVNQTKILIFFKNAKVRG